MSGSTTRRPGSSRPAARRVGVVFQDHLLFPHLSMLENVAFGPRSRGAAVAMARVSARGWLDRVGLGPVADTRPPTLSGGQAQRVALARALATEPRLLLLDEPLAALDASTRVEVRRDLRRHLREFGGTSVVVTHDPIDALTLADEVLVLEGGRITQAGLLTEVARRPRTTYAADLIGTNLVRGRGRGHVLTTGAIDLNVADPCDGEVFATIPPQAIALHTYEPAGSPRNHWSARIDGLDPVGERVRVRVGGPLPLVAEVTAAAIVELDLREGGMVWLAVKATEITTYPV